MRKNSLKRIVHCQMVEQVKNIVIRYNPGIKLYQGHAPHSASFVIPPILSRTVHVDACGFTIHPHDNTIKQGNASTKYKLVESLSGKGSQ